MGSDTTTVIVKITRMSSIGSIVFEIVSPAKGKEYWTMTVFCLCDCDIITVHIATN